MSHSDEDLDDYGNPKSGDRIIYCCFPDCGCDGSRLCQAEKGASDNAFRGNVENMYNRKDPEAVRAKMELIGIVYERDRAEALNRKPQVTP